MGMAPATTMLPMRQLPLPLAPDPLPSLDNFVPGDNQALLSYLRGLVLPSPPVYLWGPAGSGKTHLLQAVMQRAAQQGWQVQRFEPGPAEDDALPSGLCLAVIDDCDGLDEAAQARAFRWFVDAATAGVQMLAAGRVPPVDLPLREDLRTRLGWGPVFAVSPLPESQMRAALRQEAERRGVFLSDEVVDHLLTRFARNLKHLMGLLDRLDRFALARSRALTVPLLKQMIEEEGPP